MPRFLALILLFSLSGNSGFAQAELLLHVATDGNDSWSGRIERPQDEDGPLRSLAGAQQAARKALIQQRANGGSVKVLIQPGRYLLDTALVFDPSDSGLPGKPTIYQAAEPGTVTISGAKPLKPQAKAAGRNEALFGAPAVAAAFWTSGPQLYVNGRRAVLAREPNEGSTWFVGQAVTVPGEPPAKLGHEAFHAAPNVLDFLGHLSAADRDQALLHIMQSWSSGRHRLAASAPANAVRVTPRSGWPFLFFGTSQRYYVENVAAAFNHPGEWIGSADGVRYLRRGDDTAILNAELPLLEQLVVVRGSGPAGPYVEHLTLRDLGFAYTRSSTPAGGWVDGQAAIDISAAIQVDFARDLTLHGCRIESTGGYAVWLRESVRDSTVSECSMRDLGAGGVKIGNPTSTAAGAASAAATGANVVRGNSIVQTGRQYPGAVAIWIGPSFDNLVSHNTIIDTRYTGISVGWQWGYAAATSGRNRIIGNALLNIGNGELADLGGIYTLGPAPGTVIADNLISEVRGYRDLGAGAWGIYNDEGSSDLRVENNVVLGTDSGAYHLHYGRNLLLQNNLFAFGGQSEVVVTRSDPERTRLALRNNLLLTGSEHPFAGFARPPDASFDGNLVAPLGANQSLVLTPCAGGCSRVTAALTRGPGPQALSLSGVAPEAARRWIETAAAAGATGNAAAAEALAMNASTGPAAGTVAEPQARRAATALPSRAVAPPLHMTLDLASSPEGSRPAGWSYVPFAPREAMAVVVDNSAPGQRCLQFNDSASFNHRYEPYMFTRLNHDSGSSTTSFAVRIDEHAEFIHEWRDDARPYRAGPSLRITRQGVEAAGRVVAPVQPGRWLQLTVSAALAGDAGWQLKVTDADGTVYTAHGLPPKTPGWHSLRWLGFISDAAVPSSTCLAALKVTNMAP